MKTPHGGRKPALILYSNGNIKNCSLSIILTVTDLKPQKSYLTLRTPVLPITHSHGNARVL